MEQLFIDHYIFFSIISLIVIFLVLLFAEGVVKNICKMLSYRSYGACDCDEDPSEGSEDSEEGTRNTD